MCRLSEKVDSTFSHMRLVGQIGRLEVDLAFPTVQLEELSWIGTLLEK